MLSPFLPNSQGLKARPPQKRLSPFCHFDNRSAPLPRYLGNRPNTTANISKLLHCHLDNAATFLLVTLQTFQNKNGITRCTAGRIYRAPPVSTWIKQHFLLVCRALRSSPAALLAEDTGPRIGTPHSLRGDAASRSPSTITLSRKEAPCTPRSYHKKISLKTTIKRVRKSLHNSTLSQTHTLTPMLST